MLKYNDNDIIRDDDFMEELEKNKKLYKLYDKSQKIYIDNYNRMYNKKMEEINQ